MQLQFELYAEDPAEQPVHSDPFSDVALRAGDLLSDDELGVDDRTRINVDGTTAQKVEMKYNGVSSFQRNESTDRLPGATWTLEFEDGESIELTSAVLVSGIVDS
jgi:hypothetical protein